MNSDEEIKLAGESERGIKARAVLENVIYKEAFQMVEQGIIEAWKNAPIRDVEGQTNLKLMQKLLTDLRAYIEEAAETGKMAAITLEQERTLAQRARDSIREFRR